MMESIFRIPFFFISLASFIIIFMTDSTAPIPTQFLKLVGHNIKVPVRSAPNAMGTVVKYVSAGEVIEVKVLASKGFYRLADDSVSLSGLPYIYVWILYLIIHMLSFVKYCRDILTRIREM